MHQTCAAMRAMIPTSYKAKLPRQLSYPIGAETLTEGLEGAPHTESMSVSFREIPVWPGSRFRQTLAKQQPYKILVAEYRPTQKPGYGGSTSLIDSGWYEASWQLTVYPVVRELRHLANHLLREQGLPLVIQWLHSSERVGWLSRYQRIELVFNPTEESLSAQVSSGA
jgi:hypothetical protein